MAGDGGDYNFTTVGVDGAGGTQTILTGLSPFTKYGVVLQAFNSCGRGPSSPITYATTLEDSECFIYYSLLIYSFINLFIIILVFLTFFKFKFNFF